MIISVRKINEDAIPGGKADSLSVEDIAVLHDVSVSVINSELKLGIEVEKEHTTSEAIAHEIAMDHLAEDPHYYSKLKKVHSESMVFEVHVLEDSTDAEFLVEHDWSVVFQDESGETELDLESFIDLYDICDKHKKFELYDESSEFNADIEVLKYDFTAGEPIVRWQIHTPIKNNGSAQLKDFIRKFVIQQKHLSVIKEVSPPNPKIEKWIKDNKEKFVDQYGEKKGMEILYATAWKMHDGKQTHNEDTTSFSVFNEEAPANNVGSGNVKGMDPSSVAGPAPIISHSGWFANCGVFKVDPTTFYGLRHGKKHRARYTTILDSDNPLYHPIRNFAYRYKGKGIVLQNSVDGSMVYLKRPKQHSA